MSHLSNIIRKELKEMLTIGSIASLVVMMIMMMGVGMLIGEGHEDSSVPTRVGFVDGDDDSIGEWEETAKDAVVRYYMQKFGITQDEAMKYIVMIDVKGSDFDDVEMIMGLLESNGLSMAIGIGPSFSSDLDAGRQVKISQFYVYEEESLMGSASSTLPLVLIAQISNSISEKIIDDSGSGLDDKFTLSPIILSDNDTYTYFNGKVHSSVTPMLISSATMSQTLMIPIIMMMVIMMIGGMVISSVGNEKENKTLETLLTMPVSRMTIVFGKVIAAAVVGLVYGLAYMVGMSFYMNNITSSVTDLTDGTPLDLESLGLSLGITEWAMIGAMVFLTIFCVLGLCMILGAFAKNNKAAQTMMLPISILAIAPMFITMFSSMSSLPATIQGIMFAIPFTHSMTIAPNLMFGHMDMVIGGMIYLIILAIAMVMITVKVYKSDILITGIGQTKFVRRLSRKRKI